MIKIDNENLNTVIIKDTHNIIKRCVINTLVLLNRDSIVQWCVIGNIDHTDTKRILAHTGQ